MPLFLYRHENGMFINRASALVAKALSCLAMFPERHGRPADVGIRYTNMISGREFDEHRAEVSWIIFYPDPDIIGSDKIGERAVLTGESHFEFC